MKYFIDLCAEKKIQTTSEEITVSYIYTYIPLKLFPKGSRNISDIPARHPYFAKIT
jgi:hypothetical protein